MTLLHIQVSWIVEHKRWEGDDNYGTWVQTAPSETRNGEVVGYLMDGVPSAVIYEEYSNSLLTMPLDELTVINAYHGEGYA